MLILSSKRESIKAKYTLDRKGGSFTWATKISNTSETITVLLEYVKALSPQIKHATGKNIKELIYIGCAEAIGGVITDVTQTQNLKLNMDCIKKYELDVNMRTNIENQLREEFDLLGIPIRISFRKKWWDIITKSKASTN